VILFDHNIPRDQVARLRRWRLRGFHIGYDVGRPEWQDQEELRRELHRRKQVTFGTRDIGFVRAAFRHPDACIVVVIGDVMDTAANIRRFLRHASFRSKTARMGCVVKLTSESIAVQRFAHTRQERLSWR
jgi:hypothetical protein